MLLLPGSVEWECEERGEGRRVLLPRGDEGVHTPAGLSRWQRGRATAGVQVQSQGL